MGLMEEKGDPDSEPVPGWWPQSNAWLSAECTLKDVKCFFLFYLFSLFLSLFLPVPFFLLSLFVWSHHFVSLPPDCIRIDCSLSKWFYPFFWLKCICLCSGAFLLFLWPHDWHLSHYTDFCSSMFSYVWISIFGFLFFQLQTISLFFTLITIYYLCLSDQFVLFLTPQLSTHIFSFTLISTFLM